jgi:hypothetical protein
MSLLFQPEHIEAIRASEKTATRRDWADGYHRPSEGDIRMAVTEMFTSGDETCDTRANLDFITRTNR